MAQFRSLLRWLALSLVADAASSFPATGYTGASVSPSPDVTSDRRRRRGPAPVALVASTRAMGSSPSVRGRGGCRAGRGTRMIRNMAPSSGGGYDGGGGNRRQRRITVPGKRRRAGSAAATAPPRMNEYARRRVSTIFSREGGPNAEFVPLSLAGRWRGGGESMGADLETVLLSSPSECDAIADEYERYLESPAPSSGGGGEGEGTNGRDAVGKFQTAEHRALPVPIPDGGNAIRLLGGVYSPTPLSKSVLLSLNSAFVNRDDGLFDNLPWSTWSVDPNLDERDAANNVVEGKFTMGKRAAYQRFMGKDWQGRSLSLGNLANRVKYLLERTNERSGEGGDGGPIISGSDNGGATSGGGDEDMMISLSRRLLELEAKEARMCIAECEERLAVARTRSQMTASRYDGNSDEHVDIGDDDVEVGSEAAAEEQLGLARERLDNAETSLQELTLAVEDASQKRGGLGVSLVSILDKLSEQEKPPPYRGAIGYPAKLDTKKEMFEDSVEPYTSPYDLLLEVINEQLNSEVVGCVLEPTSLLEGNLVLGGAVLLQRKGVRKSTMVDGEEVYYTDDDDTLGNEGVLPRSMYVVECYGDEAIGLAMTSEVPILVEEGIYGQAGGVPVTLDLSEASVIKEQTGDDENRVRDVETQLSFVNRVPLLRPTDETRFLIQMEGERVSSEQESNAVRIPLTTNPRLFDGPGQSPKPPTEPARTSSVFSTFNPVQSLDEYDDLTDDGKVRLLLKLESFTGRLPRPRAVRTSVSKAANDEYVSGTPPSLLDDMLLPLVDESVRGQYRIRDAERRGDFEEANALREEASPRQVMLQKAQQAREEGFDEEADRLEEEARLFEALRADVTQDEGAYSRFLDRDEWYERETAARIKRVDKSKFGTLLDGIDLP